MKEIFSAMYEGALLKQVGVSTRDMLEAVHSAYANSDEVVVLFKELKADWDKSDPSQEYRLLAPFKKREALRPDFLIASTFAELAAMTDMVEGFWLNGALTFVLKNHVMRARAKADDLKFARDLFGFIPEDNALINYIFSLAPDTEWNKRNFYASTGSIEFNQWVKSVWPKMSPPTEFRCHKAVETACLASGQLDQIKVIQTRWNQFSSLLGD